MVCKIATVLVALALTAPVFVLAKAAADESEGSTAKGVTYDEHIRPILRQHCFSCHSQDEASSGLALDSYAKVIEGGSSGEVVFDDDLDSSRLWALVSHQEEPIMPPGQDKLPENQLALIRQWIETGLRENTGTAAKEKKQNVQLAIEPVVGRPAGPVAMPEGLSCESAIHTRRPAAVAALTASPWAPLVAIAGQQQVLLYHSETLELLGILPFPEGIAYALRFSRDGSKLLAAGGHNGAAGSAVLFDVTTGTRLAQIGDELDVVLAADITADLTRVALGGPGRVVRVYATETGELLHEIRKHTDWIYAIRFSPDGVLLATADRANGLFVWEADTGREYLDLRGHKAAVTDVSWRDDANVLASVSLDGTARLWDMVEGKQLKSATVDKQGVNAVWFSHDGKLATAGQDHTARLLSAELKSIKNFPSFTEPVLKVAVTHDAQQVIAGDWAGEVRVFSAEDGKQLGTLTTNPPTLASQIEQKRQQLHAARETARKASDTFARQRQSRAKLAGELEDAVASAKAELETARRLQSTFREAADGAKRQVVESQRSVDQAQQAVEKAEQALLAARNNLVKHQQLLKLSQQQELARRKEVPQSDEQTRLAEAAVKSATQMQQQLMAKMADELARFEQQANTHRVETDLLQQTLEQLLRQAATAEDETAEDEQEQPETNDVASDRVSE